MTADTLTLTFTLPNPYRVPCPKCGARANEGCVAPKSGKPQRAHRARLLYAMEIADGKRRLAGGGK